MKRINPLRQRLLLACVACALAAAVGGAQTPAGHQQQQPAAPESKAAAKPSPLEEELSKTPAGKTVARFFAAFNSGDVKVMRAFHESAGGDAGNADKDMEFYEQTGGLKPHSLLLSSKDQVAVLVQTKKDGRWMTFKFDVAAEVPHGINGISVRPATAPPPPAN